MYFVQQGNAVVADASKPGLLVHQQQPTQQPAWVQPPAGNTVMYRGATTPQTSVAVFPHPQSQQLRLSQLPVSTAQVPNQQVLVAGVQAVHPTNTLSVAAPDSDKQFVYVNVNGTLQRGVVSNGAVYLLSNSTPTVTAGPHAAAMPQTRAVPPSVGVPAAHTSMQLQKPVMQHVIHNGQLLQVPGIVAVPRMGVQPSAVPQLQPKIQTQMPARPALQGSVGPILSNQQPLVLTMSPATSSNMTALPSPRHMMPQRVSGTNLHMQPQQQPAVLQMPQAPVLDPRSAASVAAAAVYNPQPVRGMHAHGRPAGHPTSASATTASMISRVNGGNPAVSQPVPQMVPAGSQAMTIAATLAALPSHTAGGGAHTHELSSPAVPPTTPGIVINAPPSTGQTVPTAAAPVKMALGIEAASSTVNNTAQIANSSSTQVLDCPVAPGTVSLTPTGSSPLASQPGTPSRSNSVGTHSSSSSSAGGLQLPPAADPVGVNSDNDGKLTVMRMFARTFIETGIGLEQASGMIQPADRHMLEAAFAAEVASACREAQPHGVVPSSSSAAATDAAVQSKLAGLGGEPVSMPALQGPTKHGLGLQMPVALGEPVDQPAAGNSQDSFSLGGWGFSLFSITDAGSTSSAGSGSSFGDKINQTFVNSSGPDTDYSTETAIMLANLQV